MRILHVTQVYLPYHGGSAKRLSRILEGAANFPDYDQHLIATYKNVPTSCPTEETLGGVKVFRVPSLRSIPAKLMALNRQFQYDIIHVHNPRPFWFAWPFVRNTKWVFELHSLQELGKYKQKMTDFAMNKADSVVVLSQAAKDFLVENKNLPSEKLSVLANGLDFKLFQKDSESPGLNTAEKLTNPTKQTIGYLGSMYGWQGVFNLVDAMPGIISRNPNIELLLVGDGPDAAKLKAKIEELNIGSHVKMVGFVESGLVPTILEQMDLFVMLRPSTRATQLTMPMKIYEVGLASVPILVSNLPGLLEAGFDKPQDYFYIQDELSPAATAEKILSILAPGNQEDRLTKTRLYKERLVGQDISWKHVSQVQQGIHMSVLE